MKKDPSKKSESGFSARELKPLFKTPKYKKRKLDGVIYKPSTIRYSKKDKNE